MIVSYAAYILIDVHLLARSPQPFKTLPMLANRLLPPVTHLPQAKMPALSAATGPEATLGKPSVVGAPRHADYRDVQPARGGVQPASQIQQAQYKSMIDLLKVPETLPGAQAPDVKLPPGNA